MFGEALYYISFRRQFLRPRHPPRQCTVTLTVTVPSRSRPQLEAPHMFATLTHSVFTACRVQSAGPPDLCEVPNRTMSSSFTAEVQPRWHLSVSNGQLITDDTIESLFIREINVINNPVTNYSADLVLILNVMQDCTDDLGFSKKCCTYLNNDSTFCIGNAAAAKNIPKTKM